MDPLEQQQLAMPTVNVYLSIEEQILINMAKYLKKHNSVFTEDNIQSWQSLQLQELNSLTQKNIITIAKYSGLAINEVTEMLEKLGYHAQNETDLSLEDAVKLGKAIKPPVEGTGIFEQTLLAYQRQAKDTFNLVNTTLLDQSKQIYINILNETVGKVITGVSTPQKALRDVVSRWAQKGIPALIYTRKDGVTVQMTTEGYLNSVTRSMSNNVFNEIQDRRMDQYNIDLVYIDGHSGARPKCYPYQYKIYSRSGRSKKYPPLSSTSIGEPDGIRGVNCRHHLHPHIEGVTKHDNPKKQSKEENDKTYLESQQQRLLERKIRQAKRELNMLSTMGDDEGIKMAKQKVRQAQDDIRTFIEDTGRTRNRNREQLLKDNPNVGGGKLKQS